MIAANSLSLELRWLELEGNTDRLTTAELLVLVGGQAIWPARGEPSVTLEIQIDDLLSHLTEFWKPLVLRQTFPIPVAPQSPSLLRHEAEKRWADLPSVAVEREEELVAAFEDAHDLSRAFAGLFGLPPLWLLRAGEYLIVETPDTASRISFRQARDALVAIGDSIAHRLSTSTTRKWTLLIDAWRRRDEGDPATLVAWSTNLSRDVASKFISEGMLESVSNVAEVANDNDELRIAARMASALPSENIRQIIRHVQSFSKHSAPALDQLAKQVRSHIDEAFSNHRAHEQGEAAATELRQRLDLASVQTVDVFSLVEQLGVELHVQSVDPPTLDGIAVWGNRYGPAVLVNERSARLRWQGDLRNNGAARITLAHELCHLLLDREHTLSAVDVLKSFMPLDVERRAKSFAGEFLLPARVAAGSWNRLGHPSSAKDVKPFLARLSKRYGVTLSVAAWKLEHGLIRDGIDLSPVLDAVAPNR
ncbi:MAG: ImmA/IrrE family metallo-endopeptidase [Rhodospirillales bacterium]|nr:ImmA/IrrE family metallo-endopeptidase [Rhodospirillales bacterium]